VVGQRVVDVALEGGDRLEVVVGRAVLHEGPVEGTW
jgi:hypothetical protein